MSFIKAAIKSYKQLKYEEKQRKRLLETQLDYGALQSMIDRAEENPDLVIKITLNNGTRLEVTSRKRNTRTSFSDYINGENDVLEIN